AEWTMTPPHERRRGQHGQNVGEDRLPERGFLNRERKRFARDDVPSARDQREPRSIELGQELGPSLRDIVREGEGRGRGTVGEQVLRGRNPPVGLAALVRGKKMTLADYVSGK